MADELTPGQIRARRFDLVRKGYDRSQVDSFLAGLADELEAIEASMPTDTERGIELGIDDHEALARELDRIGGDVADVLEAARSAAEGMRTRAAEDAEAWRSEATAEAAELRAAAVSQSEAMRESAWAEGSAMLAAAEADAKAIVAEAKDESLFVRAEAEREALRLTGDARRDREESVRAARLEAEQILDAARHESDGVLAAAGQQASLAQERARALEDRRSELLGELEAARAAIGELENEIESKRQELETPPEPEEVVTEVTHHGEDGGSVRIVSPARVVPHQPVDADELVAEVTALRSGVPIAQPIPEADAASTDTVGQPSGEPVQPSQEPVQEVGTPSTSDTAAPTDREEASADPDEGGTDGSAPVSAESDREDAVAETSSSIPPPAADTIETAEDPDSPMPPSSESVPPPSPPPAPLAPGGDTLGSLFAELKNTPDIAPDRPSPSPPDPPAPASSVTPAVREEPAAPPPPTPSSGGGDLDPSAVAAQNEALRAIKRTLVDLQNETLEHLRSDAGWTPPSAFTDRFSEPFSDLVVALGGRADASAGTMFGADLGDAVGAAINRTRGAGAGDREVAAAASKVFRTWRSDEAERRVVDAAHSLAGV